MWSREGLKNGSSTMMPLYRSTPHLFVYQPCEDDGVGVDTVVMDDDVDTEPSDSGYADSTRSGGAASSGGSATTPEAIYYSPMELAQRKEKDAIRRLSLKYGGDGSEVYSNGSSAGSSSGDSADDHPTMKSTQLTELELLRVETFFRGNQTQIFVGKSLANL